MINSRTSRGGVVRRHWLSINKAVLLAAVAMTVAQWFRPAISSTVSDLLFIVTFVMYLASEKVEGRVLPTQEKAFCYFITYVLGFFIIERQLHRLISKPAMTYIVLSITFFLFLLVAFQIHYFQRQAKNRVVAGSVLALGFLTIACVGYVPSASLFRSRPHLEKKAAMASTPAGEAGRSISGHSAHD